MVGRAVRIPVRRVGLTDRAASSPEPEIAGPYRTESGSFATNRSATKRAYRSFTIYLGATLAIYLMLVGLAFSSPAPGVRNNPADFGLFTAFLVGIGIAAYALTVLPTPRGTQVDGAQIVVTERTGRERRIPADPAALRPLILKRFRAGPLNDGPVLLIQVALPNGRQRTYLVDEGLIPIGAGPA